MPDGIVEGFKNLRQQAFENPVEPAETAAFALEDEVGAVQSFAGIRDRERTPSGTFQSDFNASVHRRLFNRQHDLMKATRSAWIGNHGLDGIISINSNDDLVIVYRPVDDLKPVGEAQL